MSAAHIRNLADWLAVRGLTLVPSARSNQRDKHVVLTIDDFRTRVQFPPGPPAKRKKPPSGGFLFVVASQWRYDTHKEVYFHAHQYRSR